MENGNSVTTTSEAPTTSAASPYPNDVKMTSIIEDVMVELHQAMAAASPMHSLHEGLSVIQEEVFELQTEVYKNPRKHPTGTSWRGRKRFRWRRWRYACCTISCECISLRV